MSTLDEASIIELGTAPLPAGVGGGDDANDIENDHVFIAVDKVLKRVANGPDGDIDPNDVTKRLPPIDWYEVINQCQGLLKSKTKHVRVMEALGLALFQRHGYEGLAAAMGLFESAVTHLWDALSPPRPRARAGRIAAMCHRFGDGNEAPNDLTFWFRKQPPGPSDLAALDTCIQRAESLIVAWKAKSPADELALGPFLRRVRALADSLPRQTETTSPPQQTPPGTPNNGTGQAPHTPVVAPLPPTATAPPPPTPPVSPPTDTDAARKNIREQAKYIRENDPTNPISYAVVRALRWSKAILPEAGAARSMIDLPGGGEREQLQGLHKDAKWPALLEAAESAFYRVSVDPLWLDCQFYVCAAMGNLGTPYQEARAAVIAATQALVQRLGTAIFELQFKGSGTTIPMCGGLARAWIDSEVCPPTKGGGGGGGGGENPRLIEAAGNADKLAGNGKLAEAMEVWEETLRSCGPRRDQLACRLGAAGLAFKAQQHLLAAAILENCRKTITDFRIHEWEPALAIEAALALYKCRSALSNREKPSASEISATREAFDWLCQISPAAGAAAGAPVSRE